MKTKEYFKMSKNNELCKIKENLKSIIYGEYLVLKNSTTGKFDVIVYSKDCEMLHPFSAEIHSEDDSLLNLTSINEEHIEIIEAGLTKAVLTEEFLISG